MNPTTHPGTSPRIPLRRVPAAVMFVGVWPDDRRAHFSRQSFRPLDCVKVSIVDTCSATSSIFVAHVRMSLA